MKKHNLILINLIPGRFLRKIAVAFFISFIFCPLWGAEIKIISLTGLVQIKKTAASDWQKAEAGQKLQAGHIIFTGFNSSAVIGLERARLEVKPLSQATVKSLLATEELVATDIYLKYGKVKAEVEKTADLATSFQVRTANVTASVRGTIFLFGEDSLFVEEGTVLLKGYHGDTALIQKNEQANTAFLAMIEDPLAVYLSEYHVDVRPFGMAGGESSPGYLDQAPAQDFTARAKVVIKIKVIY